MRNLVRGGKTESAPRRHPNRRASEAKSDKRQRIMRAATHVFAQKGFFHAKVSEIAEEAGVADGTIYLYYKNKEDLLISIFEDRMDWFIRQCREAIGKENNVLDKLRRLILFHLELTETDQDLAEVLTVELRQSAKFMREYENIKFAEYMDLIQRVIEQGQEEGTVRSEISPRILKRAVFGAMDEIALQWALMPYKRFSLRAAAEEIAEIFIRGIRAKQE